MEVAALSLFFKRSSKMEKVKLLVSRKQPAKLRIIKPEVMSCYPIRNASSDVWFVLQEVAKRTGIERLKELLIDDALQLMSERLARVLMLADEMVGTCTFKFDDLDDYLVVYDLCNAFMLLGMLEATGQVLLTDLEWQTVKWACEDGCQDFYNGCAISGQNIAELIDKIRERK